ncbi:MAG: NAD(P)/FAD-dependent oxidoreductase [Chthoniobacterales bacterium]|nr:NAD(P)/FAD-dependent oxidoreductase [Chthoniobacterales bacterium]
MRQERIVIAGRGAAGFFAAIACAEARPENEVTIFERSSQFLTKVRISGGGRCNVTHSAMELRAFSSRYPRGNRTLISALHTFSPEDTLAWFQRRGVRLKTEVDGRMFPVTDSSGTVIDCLLHEAEVAGVRLRACTGVDGATRNASGGFDLQLTSGETTTCDRLLLATGGARAASGADIAQALGHTVEPPVPSLFSLHVTTEWLRALPGVAVTDAEVTVPGTKLRERGPLLITHTGVSGPVILRLSAWGARVLAERDYKFSLRVNWMPDMTADKIAREFHERRSTHSRRHISSVPVAALPARLWEQLVTMSGVPAETIWTTLSRSHAAALVELLKKSELAVDGQSLNKDEFVTCGGVNLREVNFKTMESRIVPHLYFAGELLDIDAITGGFNFQAAWTTGWIAGHAMADTTPLVRE